MLDTKNIPELNFIHSWLSDNQASFLRIIEQYSTLLGQIFNLKRNEVETITAARKKMITEGIRLHSSSKLLTSDFIKKAQKEQSNLHSVFDNAFVFNQHQTVLNKLQNMLENGSNIALDSRNSKPKDGDKVWDSVIWGHTQANTNINKEVLIHFLLSHYLCQYMNHYLGEEYNLGEKDDFINVLGDLILFNKITGENTDRMYKYWSDTKEEGGLGWIDDKQLQVYNQIHNF